MNNFNSVNDELIHTCLLKLGRANQKKAVLNYIVKNPFSLTSKITANAGAINVPQVVKEINIRCNPYGLNIFNYCPNDKHKNRHGEISMLHRWFSEAVK